MPDMMFRAGSLVLYKNRPAQVKRVADKLEIETDQGTTLNVRPKDISLLHPGPLSSLDELRPPVGEVKTAWELLAGETTSLPELAELAYDAYTPATAWAAWQLVADGLYFRGTPETISAATPEEVAAGQLARESKAAEAQAWAGFLERARQGRFESADSRFLREVEEAALGLHPKSRVLQALGSSQTPENAHAWLLKLGYWDQTVNPYPRRLGVTTTQPEVDLPDVPDEARVDLTHLPAFAIDDEGSRDPDDALSLVERRLWVHVADVAALAPPDSPADEQARGRGANLYMPETTVTMLPAKATQLLGLGLSEVSPALSFGLDLDAEGNVTEMEVVPSWVRVQRLTYEAVETRLAEEPFHSMLRLARHHHARRTANGAILIDLPEIKIRVQDDEVVLRPLPALKSRDLVREAMLMAGEAVGHFALEHDIPFPFTTQEPPETDEDFPDTIAGMVARRRTMQRSQMKSTPASHAGLGMDVYAQATSPLRRYLDLVVHQQLRAYLHGTGLLDPQQVLERVGAAESITGSIRQAERLAQKHWTLVYLLQHPGWHGEGVLVDKRGSRSRVLIPELDLEVQVHVRDDLPLDSRLSLRLTGVDLAELEAHFRAEG